VKRSSWMFVLLTLAVVGLFAAQEPAQKTEPLKLVQTIELPDVPNFLYAGEMALDMKRHHLFAAQQATKSVVVIDLDSAKVLQKIPVEYAHSLRYMSDLDQLWVTDQGQIEPGVKIFDGRDYHLIKAIKLLARTDAVGYDPETKYLYVINGGKAAKQDHSLLSIFDTTKGEVVGDIQVPSTQLEPMALDPTSSKIYINFRDKDQVGVLDRRKRAFVEAWQITKAHGPSAIALDEKRHRLFVACRTVEMHGHIVVFDTQTGKEITALLIGGHVDSLDYDESNRRLYAACATGEVDVYQQTDADHYVSLGKVETGIYARAGLLVPELHKYFVSVPTVGSQSAEILVFQIR
jgi:DNA-binding beta-propeller fold protein YncE